MRVLLIHPGGAISGVGAAWNRTIPITLPYLAALTPPEVQVEIRYLGQRAIDDAYDKEYDVVGISSLTTHAERAFQIADTFRARGRRVVIGGVHATIAPDQAAEHSDAVVIGEAESLWPKVLMDAKNNCLKELYKNEQLPDLSGVPSPRFDLLDLGRNNGKIYYPVYTSKGCPNRCEFCSIPELSGHKLRTRPVGDVVRDVKSIIENMNCRKILFVDDNIIGHRKYAKALFEELIPLKIRWCGESTLDIADDPELLDLAVESGLIELSVGLESTNEDSLLEVRKNSNVVERYADQIRKIQNKRVTLVANIMFGFDHDSRESLLETPEKLIRWKLHLISPFILRPIVGTKLFDRLEKEDRLLPEAFFLNTRTDIAAFVPKQMSPKELEEIFMKVCLRFYSLPSVARRLLLPPGPAFLKPLFLNILANLQIHQVPRLKRIPILSRMASLLKGFLRARIRSLKK